MTDSNAEFTPTNEAIIEQAKLQTDAEIRYARNLVDSFNLTDQVPEKYQNSEHFFWLFNRTYKEHLRISSEGQDDPDNAEEQAAKTALDTTRKEVDLEEQLETDPLTGAASRVGIERYMQNMLSHLRDDEKLGIAVFDLDKFKSANDILGHDIGNVVLQELGKLVMENLQGVDKLGRFGGDEFILSFAGIPSLNLVAQRTEEIRKIIEENLKNKIIERLRNETKLTDTIKSHLDNLQMTATFGVATLTREDASKGIEELMSEADHKLIEGKKKQERNKVHGYEMKNITDQVKILD